MWNIDINDLLSYHFMIQNSQVLLAVKQHCLRSLVSFITELMTIQLYSNKS